MIYPYELKIATPASGTSNEVELPPVLRGNPVPKRRLEVVLLRIPFAVIELSAFAITPNIEAK